MGIDGTGIFSIARVHTLPDLPGTQRHGRSKVAFDESVEFVNRTYSIVTM